MLRIIKSALMSSLGPRVSDRRECDVGVTCSHIDQIERTDLPPAELPDWARDVQSRMIPAKMNWELIEREGSAWMARWDREVRGRGN